VTIDPFSIRLTPPEGMAYQWIPLDDPDYEIMPKFDAAWKPVSADRHQNMPRNTKGQVSWMGQVLCERPKADVDDARQAQIAAAEKLEADGLQAIKNAVAGFGENVEVTVKKTSVDYFKSARS
jgi:hypothetical protein